MGRENTFKIDFSQFVVKPAVEKVYNFCRSNLGLKREDIKRLQCHRGGACAFIKVSDLMIAQKVVEEHDGKHEVECSEGKKHKLRITLEDGSVEVRVYDLPEDVSEEKVEEFLTAFGEVSSIREVSWGESAEAEGIPLGVWSARMLVKRNIDSWVNIDGEQAFVVYKGQLQSCRHCKEQSHTGISCVQNKKLLFQKSYANVTKQSGHMKGSTTGQQPRKAAGARPRGTKAVGPKTTAATPTPPPSDVFPPLPSATSQLTTVAVPSSSQQQQNSPLPSSSFLAPPQPIVALADLFKKSKQQRSKSKSGNETDDSSTSTSSKTRKNASKKARRDSQGPSGDDDMDAEEEEKIDL